jgi:sterol 24-C-methyltransferase
MGTAGNVTRLALIALSIGIAYFFQRREDAWYRLTTSLTAVRAIAKMPEDKLRAFILSYRMFEMDQFVGDESEETLLTDYYSVLNHLCAIGNFEKMYLPPYLDANRDVYENQKLYERQMADYLQIGPQSKALDLGCGRGRIAHHVASYTGAHVTGLNVDKEQIGLAKEYAEQTGLWGKSLDFKVANYNDRLPFPDGHFDAVYYVQVLSYSTNLTAFFKEVFRVVKPGGRVAFEDYVLGTSYNDSDAHHRSLKGQYKPVLGGVETSLPSAFKEAVEAAGFQVSLHKDESINGRQWPLLEKEKNFWLPLSSFVGFLYRIGLVPQIYYDVMERMTRGTDALIESDRLGIVSCGYVTFAQRPA